MKTKDEILIAYGVSIIQDGNDYLKYGVTLNKIRLAMQDYASEQCHKRDELIKAQDDMLMLFPPTIYWCDAMDGLRDKIEQLKKEIQ